VPGPYTAIDAPSMTIRTDSDPRTNSQALVVVLKRIGSGRALCDVC
jgi:hypothetical protein